MGQFSPFWKFPVSYVPTSHNHHGEMRVIRKKRSNSLCCPLVSCVDDLIGVATLVEPSSVGNRSRRYRFLLMLWYYLYLSTRLCTVYTGRESDLFVSRLCVSPEKQRSTPIIDIVYLLFACQIYKKVKPLMDALEAAQEAKAAAIADLAKVGQTMA